MDSRGHGEPADTRGRAAGNDLAQLQDRQVVGRSARRPHAGRYGGVARTKPVVGVDGPVGRFSTVREL